LSVKWHQSGQKILPAILKSLSTGVEDASMQRNLFSSKITLRIIRNVIMPETIGVDFLFFLDDIFKLVFQYFNALIYCLTLKKSKFFITLPFKEVERIELIW